MEAILRTFHKLIWLASVGDIGVDRAAVPPGHRHLEATFVGARRLATSMAHREFAERHAFRQYRATPSCG